MTREEFVQQADRLWSCIPRGPVVFELADGRRLVVESQEQSSPGPTAVGVRNPPSANETVPYDAILRVVGLDEAPAETGGLGYGEFYAAVRPLLRAEPFRPFYIEFRNGRKIGVRSPGRLTLNGRYGVYMRHDQPGLVPFDVDQVARVFLPEPAPVG